MKSENSGLEMWHGSPLRGLIYQFRPYPPPEANLALLYLPQSALLMDQEEVRSTLIHDFFIHMILSRCQSRHLDTEKIFCLSSSDQVLHVDMNTLGDSYAWNYRKLGTLLTRSEILAEGGLEPLTIGPMRKNLTTESHSDTLRQNGDRRNYFHCKSASDTIQCSDRRNEL